MSQYKILIVDDDEAIRKLLKRYLESNAFTVVEAKDGSDALLLAKESSMDAILSDAEMPGLSGHQLCHALRQNTSTQKIPIILMSGKKIEENEIVAGFEQGADDYILKPFSMPVMLAHIKATIKRAEKPTGIDDAIVKGELTLDPQGRTVKIGGAPIRLTRKEFDLLMILVRKAGRVLSVGYLLEVVWGYDLADYTDPATVETHISHLRKKLGPKIGKRIVNYTGNGYKFEDL